MGQNSTQKPHDLQRSTTMSTRPFATSPPRAGVIGHSKRHKHYGEAKLQPGVTVITLGCEVGYKEKAGREDAPTIDKGLRIVPFHRETSNNLFGSGSDFLLYERIVIGSSFNSRCEVAGRLLGENCVEKAQG